MARDTAESIVVTSQPEAEAYVRDEVHAHVAEARFVRLAPGVLRAEVGATGAARLFAGWRARPPVFTRHVFPVHATAELGADPIAQLADLLVAETRGLDGFAAVLKAGRTFSVQTRVLEAASAAGTSKAPEEAAAEHEALVLKPFDVNRAVSDALTAATGAALDVRAPQLIVSVAIQPHTRTALIGISEAAANLSAWGGGAQRFAREDGQVSRAEFKLLEALSVFGVTLPAAGRALDLGASPGGWTRLLAARMAQVMAVDPAALDPKVAALKNVQAARMTAERFLATATPGSIDVLANDMRLDAVDSAQVMRSALRVMAPRGVALMTLKLPERGSRARFEEACGVLRGGWTIAHARQLFHNRSEVTLWLEVPAR